MSKKSETTNSFKNDNKEKEPVLSKSLNSSLSENSKKTQALMMFTRNTPLRKKILFQRKTVESSSPQRNRRS